MRILCDAEPKDPENIDPGSIKAVEIVSLPAKEVVGSLADGIIYDGFSLVWSKDSQWRAFHSSSGSRVSETSAYNLQDGKFVVRFDEHGKFQVISKKKIPSKE